MEHFRILPTDKRFKGLSSDLKEVLFVNFLTGLSEEEHRAIYRDEQKGEELAEIMRDMGYTEEQIQEAVEGAV